MTDEQLITGLKQRDAAAADELYERFAAPLVRYFQAALPDASMAEDAAQEVFCRLVDAVHRDRVQQLRSLNALVFTIARRLAIDIGRSWQRRPAQVSIEQPLRPGDGRSATIEDVLPDGKQGPREVAIEHERGETLLVLLRELDPETREIIVLRHIEGFSSREVARMMNLPEGTVWSRLHRGLKTLRTMINRQERHKERSPHYRESESADV